MKTKVFEVRDRMTFIPIIATKIDHTNENEKFLLERAGYKREDNRVFVTKLMTLETQDLSNKWNDETMQAAHSLLEEEFEILGYGSVLDAEYIRGERDKPRLSERAEQLGLTLKEFAQGMLEVDANTQFLKELAVLSFKTSNECLKHIYDHAEKYLEPRYRIEWITAIFRSRTGLNDTIINQAYIRKSLVGMGLRVE